RMAHPGGHGRPGTPREETSGPRRRAGRADGTAPRTRGCEGGGGMSWWNWQSAADAFPLLLKGFGTTLVATVGGTAIAVVLGLLIAVVLRTLPTWFVWLPKLLVA